MIRNGLVPAARRTLRVLLGLGAVILCYLAAALVGSAIPANRDWKPAGGGVTIYVADNGVHTDLVLRPEEYARLVDYVRDTFAAGTPVRGYGGHDAFYAARRGYSALRTCNEWSARGLRFAGVRMGAWTPFAFGVMWWL